MDCREAQSYGWDTDASRERRTERSEHLSGCEACRARDAVERSLTEALRELRDSEEFGVGDPRPAATERLLLDGFDRRAEAVDRGAPWWKLAAAAGVLLAIGLATGIDRSGPPETPPPLAQPAAELVGDFIVLDRLSMELSGGRGRLLRIEIPAESGAYLGLPLPRRPGAPPIAADVFLVDDGVAGAVRFVY